MAVNEQTLIKGADPTKELVGETSRTATSTPKGPPGIGLKRTPGDGTRRSDPEGSRIESHTGYEVGETDVHDATALHRPFGLPVPDIHTDLIDT